MTERRVVEAPVGVFDSGVGGSPCSRRSPGPAWRTSSTWAIPRGAGAHAARTRFVAAYSLQAASRLHDSGVKCLVVACNTASAIALDTLAHEFAPAPVLGVLEPGAVAAAAPRAPGASR